MGTATFQRSECAGFLTANVGSGTAMEIYLQVIAGIQDVFAQEPFSSGFIESAI